MEDSFYLTLLSNSSLDIFPENKTSSFKVFLNKEINLEGHWNCALSEIIYPNTFHNVGTGNEKIYVKFICNVVEDGLTLERKVKSFTLKIDLGFYTNLEALLKGVNRVFKNQFSCELFYGEATEDNFIIVQQQQLKAMFGQMYLDTVSLYREEEEIDEQTEKARKIEYDVDINIRLDPILALQLGFTPCSNIFNLEISPHTAGVTLGLPKEILIYVNIIEPQIISNVNAQVLKIVKALDKNMSFGETVAREILNRNYVRVNKKCFQVISIELRDSTGNFIPFAHGLSLVVVHFKKVS